VLSFPFQLRFALASNPQLYSKAVSTFLGIVFSWQRLRGRHLGIAEGQTGSITFLQRFGGSLNLNPHAHCVVPDGLFVPSASGTGPLSFVPLPPPTDEDVALLTRRITRRITDLARRTLGEDGEASAEDDEERIVLGHDLASALVPPPGDQTLVPPSRLPPLPAKPLTALVDGFSLHAARTVGERDRKGLERLCRYGLRSPFSQERLSLLHDGRVTYELAKPWPTGRTELVLEPLDFLRRLAALIPAPYANMVRYHGVFANRSRYRAQLPAPPPPPSSPGPSSEPPPPQGAANQDQEPGGASPVSPPPMPPTPEPTPARRRRTPWATLLRRVFDVDALACARCSTPMVVLAFITDPNVLRKILGHLGLPTTPPILAPAKLPLELELPLEDGREDDVGYLEDEEPLFLMMQHRQLPPAPL